MSPTLTFSRIQKDDQYLVRSYFFDSALTVLILAGLQFGDWRPGGFLGNWALALLPFAIIWGCMIASFLHNTSHENVGGKIMNRLAGEFCGVWVLYGFTNFIMVHHLHHRYSDEKHDPVHPGEMNFLVFLSAPMRYMIKAAKGWLREQHGHLSDYEWTMKLQIALFHLNLVLKIFFWRAVMGQELFLFFYLPSLLANYAILAHINYVCHRDHADGSVEIVNLNHNAYYRFANLITFGGYFHKNHHIRLNVFHPGKLQGARFERPYFSVRPLLENVEALPVRKQNISRFVRYFDLQVWGEARKTMNKPIQKNIFMISAREARYREIPVIRSNP